MYFETECIMAVRGHQRSLTLAPVKNAYATSYWSSTVTLVILPRFRDIAGFLLKTAYHSYSTQILGCSLGLDCQCWVSEE